MHCPLTLIDSNDFENQISMLELFLKKADKKIFCGEVNTTEKNYFT